MPNLTVIFKQEITRLARKEARSFTKSLTKASAQFRRDIAELKRRSAKAKAEIAHLTRQLSKTPSAPTSQPESGKVRFTVKTVKAQRIRLGLSQTAFAKLVGVSSQAVYTWESGISKPRKAQIAVIAGLRGLGRIEAQKRLEETGRKATNGRRKNWY